MSASWSRTENLIYRAMLEDAPTVQMIYRALERCLEAAAFVIVLSLCCQHRRLFKLKNISTTKVSVSYWLILSGR